ncbi:MAG: hypothetical protein R3357_15870 [Burkholderiales bacterium]|nr:hypothetical protein [Burkholderiales bacterium]
MARIVAGRFQTEQRAEEAVSALAEAGIGRDKLANFVVLPPGQHALHPLGGDAGHDRGTRKSPRGAALGIAGGVVVGALLGWLIASAIDLAQDMMVLAVLAGAAAGAYVGSFVGALAKTRAPNPNLASPEEPVSRKAGPLVAAEVGDHEQQFAAACDVLAGYDAFEIEQADGTIRDGDWVDFDPRLPPRIIVPGRRSAAASAIGRAASER